MKCDGKPDRIFRRKEKYPSAIELQKYRNVA